MADNALKDVPEHYLMPIVHYITGLQNLSGKEITEPMVKPALSNYYFLFIIQYGLLAVCGIASNIFIIYYICRHRLYHDGTHAFVINLSLCHLVQCAGVLPVTLMVILIQTWLFGQFMCYFVPLLQDIPLHAALLTQILIAWDRMRWIKDPMNPRLPAFVCSCATWLTGMVIALPYPIYTTYLDLGMYLPKFRGVGICIVNLVDDMQEYTRGLFFLMYCAPITLLGYLYVHTARELRPPEGALSIMMYEHRAEILNRQKHSTASTTRGTPRSNCARSYDLYDAEVDAAREKRTQCHLGGIAATQAICICPLMILRIARMVLVETYENSAHFDITYLMFVWIAFLPTVINPCIYASWMLSRPAKDRLRRYFRLSSRQSENDNKFSSQRSNENSVIQENTTETIGESKVDHTIERAPKINATNVSETSAAAKANATKQHTSRSIERVPNKTNAKQRTGHRERKSSGGTSGSHRNRSIDEMNNSCSNITTSTYCNGNEMSTSSGIGLDFESGTYNERRPLCDRESVYSGTSTDRYSHRSRELMSECDNVSTRRESSSTYERDMDIIDLLERERSMDIQDMLERERRIEQQRKKPSLSRSSGRSAVSGHRKLPDITRIATPNSPKRSVVAESTNNFPNFVFTHQQNEFADAHSNRNRKSISGQSYSSFSKRNSDAYVNEVEAVDIDRLSQARSTDSRKSSIKSVRDPRCGSAVSVGGIGKYSDSIYPKSNHL